MGFLVLVGRLLFLLLCGSSRSLLLRERARTQGWGTCRKLWNQEQKQQQQQQQQTRQTLSPQHFCSRTHKMLLTPEGFEPPAFGSGIRRAAIAPWSHVLLHIPCPLSTSAGTGVARRATRPSVEPQGRNWTAHQT